jgi:nuclear pore complex protein Nup210
MKTGSATVSVRLASKSSYASVVPPAEVNVLVVANLFIVPSVAFVMPGATVHYHAEQIKSNKVFLKYF